MDWAQWLVVYGLCGVLTNGVLWAISRHEPLPAVRADPEEEWEAALLVLLVWPLPVGVLAIRALRWGLRVPRRVARWHKRRQTPDGWHEYRDGKMLVRWKEVD